MQDFLKQIQQLHNWKQSLREACKKNRICTSAAGQLTPNKLKTLNQRFKKAYKMEKQSDSWIQHQKRVFNWILIAFSALKNVAISHFGEQEWSKLYQIFQFKSQNFLRYETRRYLLQKIPNNRHWTESEQKILSSLIKEHEKQYTKKPIVWHEIALKLFEKSQQQFFRTAKQCRQRWSNYLDPNKIRGEWTVEQQLALLQKVESKGKKWAQLAQELNRNEHCVKNKYNSIISLQRKTTPNLHKEQKLVEQAKKRLQRISALQILPQVAQQAPPEVPQDFIVTQEPKIRIKFKNSSQSFFDDNRSILNYNNQFQNKNRLEFPYCIQGGQFVKHLIRQDQDQQKNQLFNNQSTFWNNSSPKMLTPFGLTLSPITFSYSMGEFNNHFHNRMQSWGKNQKLQHHK